MLITNSLRLGKNYTRDGYNSYLFNAASVPTYFKSLDISESGLSLSRESVLDMPNKPSPPPTNAK